MRKEWNCVIIDDSFVQFMSIIFFTFVIIYFVGVGVITGRWKWGMIIFTFFLMIVTLLQIWIL